MYDDNLFAVDTTGVEEMGGYEVYPAGIYPAMMISASRKEAKNAGNYFLECVYQFIEGDYAGRKYTSRLNLWNSNSDAVNIAKRELKSLRVALGVSDHDGSTQSFLHKPLLLTISVKQRRDQPDKAENNLVKIEAYGSGATPAQSPMPQPGFQPPQYAPTQPSAQSVHQQPAPQTQWQPPQQAQPQPRAAAAPAFVPGGQTPPWMQGAR
jgi:hypothetical protein